MREFNTDFMLVTRDIRLPTNAQSKSELDTIIDANDLRQEGAPFITDYNRASQMVQFHKGSIEHAEEVLAFYLHPVSVEYLPESKYELHGIVEQYMTEKEIGLWGGNEFFVTWLNSISEAVYNIIKEEVELEWTM